MLNSNRESLRVDSLVALPGERVVGYLPVGETPDGLPIRIPIGIVRGREAGPVVYVQAVSDGDELNGVAVVHRFLKSLDTGSLRGGVIAVPLVNGLAFAAHQATNPVDGKKLNRCFPGRVDGSLSDRIAYHLFQKAILSADVCVDLHQGSVRPMIDEVRVRVGREHHLHDACFELALVFGVGYVLDEKGPSGQLAQVAPDHGIPTIDPELGGCHGWNESSIEKGLRGLRNVLIYYGLVDGTLQRPNRQFVVERFAPVRPEHGGFVEWKRNLYDEVAGGDDLGTVHDVFGNPVETLRAPCHGIVWAQSLYPSVSSGESAMTLGANPRVVES